MYTHPYIDPDRGHHSLQRKVQFDIRFFFSRRGSKNMELMKKDDFAMCFDTKNELWYVKKVKDELTKNHKDPEGIVTGYMPENKDDKLCPVRSYRMYLDRLEPSNEYLWQSPHRKFNASLKYWYTKQHLGKNTLSAFMMDISKECHLSIRYTNHSIRATGISVLTRQDFTNSEIMAVSGHESVQSLSIYQKTGSKEKLEIGNVLFQAVTKPEDEIVHPNKLKEIELPPVKQALPPPCREIKA